MYMYGKLIGGLMVYCTANAVLRNNIYGVTLAPGTGVLIRNIPLCPYAKYARFTEDGRVYEEGAMWTLPTVFGGQTGFLKRSDGTYRYNRVYVDVPMITLAITI